VLQVTSSTEERTRTEEEEEDWSEDGALMDTHMICVGGLIAQRRGEKFFLQTEK
jgi:hypothetical protein